jgi:hypothetical protein
MMGRRLAERRHVAAAAVVLALALATHPSRAEPPHVVLVGHASEDPALARLRAELEALGFQVVEVPAPAEPPAREALEATARAAGAVAAVRLAPASTGRGVEVWIVDRVTGKTVLREVVASASAADLAVRVVELLRASLLEMDAPHPSRGEVPPPVELRTFTQPAVAPLPVSPPPAPAPAPARAPATWPWLGAMVGGAVVGSPGGVPIGGLVDARLRWMHFKRFGLSAGALIPTTAGTIKTSIGAADLHQGLAGGGVRVELGSAAGTWRPSLEAGLSAAWLATQGTAASSGLTVLGKTVVSAAPYARAGLASALAPWIAVRADVLAAAALRRMSVNFTSTEVARWGQPILGGSLGIELSLR